MSEFYKQGWACPKCGRVMSPMTQYCLWCAGETTAAATTITSTTHTNDHLTDKNYVGTTCGNCTHTDGLCYASFPPKFKCTLTGEVHEGDFECDVECVIKTKQNRAEVEE